LSIMRIAYFWSNCPHPILCVNLYHGGPGPGRVAADDRSETGLCSPRALAPLLERRLIIARVRTPEPRVLEYVRA